MQYPKDAKPLLSDGSDARLPSLESHSVHDRRPGGQKGRESTGSRAPIPFEAEIQALSYLAGRLVDSDDARIIEEVSAELVSRVSDHLAAARDDVLNQALGVALTTHGERSFAAMMEVIEETSTSWISTMDDGSRISTSVALIPVYISNDFTTTLPRSLEANAEAFDDLAASLRRNGLVRPEGCAFVLPGLYTRAEIEAVAFSRVYRLARHMTAVVEGEGQLDIPDITNPYTTAPTSPSLRYIIVGHRDDETVCPFLPFYQEGFELAPHLEASVMAWAPEFSAIVRRCIDLPNAKVMVTPPEPFFAGLRTGAQQHRTAVFHLSTLAQLASVGADASVVRALVYTLGNRSGRPEVVASYRPLP
jgi:hypothetical protein